MRFGNNGDLYTCTFVVVFLTSIRIVYLGRDDWHTTIFFSLTCWRLFYGNAFRRVRCSGTNVVYFSTRSSQCVVRRQYIVEFPLSVMSPVREPCVRARCPDKYSFFTILKTV